MADRHIHRSADGTVNYYTEAGLDALWAVMKRAGVPPNEYVCVTFSADHLSRCVLPSGHEGDHRMERVV